MHPTPEQWMEYLYGELDERQDDALADHLAQCTTCQNQVQGWRRTMTALDDWRIPEPAAPRLRRPVFSWAAAALVFVAVGLGTGLWLGQTRTNPAALAARETRLREEIRQGLQKELARVSLETVAASRAVTDQRLAEMARTLDEQRRQEYRVLIHMMDRLDRQRRRDATAMRGDLAILARETGDELMRTKNNIFEVFRTLSDSPQGLDVPPR